MLALGLGIPDVAVVDSGPAVPPGDLELEDSSGHLALEVSGVLQLER